MIAPSSSRYSSNDIVYNYYLEKAKKSAQLQKDKEVNGKPSMIDPARLPNTANGCKPKPRNWQASMSSRVSNEDVHLGEHRKQKPFLKFNDLQCPTCKKCLYSANHDECVLEYLSRLNPRAPAQDKDAKSHKTTKRYMPVEKSSASKKQERQIPTGHRHKGNEIANHVYSQSESISVEDSDQNKAREGEMMMCKQAEQGCSHQTVQADWLEGHGMKRLKNRNWSTLQLHGKISEVSPEESCVYWSATGTWIDSNAIPDSSLIYVPMLIRLISNAAECVDARLMAIDNLMLI
ncbi:hypothetical protein Tco_0432815 [Tanacetum coccineum]